MRRSASFLAGLAVAVLLSGCASTKFVTTWAAPDLKPLDFKGKKVVAIVVAGSDALRRPSEEALARHISQRGAQGIAGYVILPSDKYKDKDAAAAKLKEEGVAGAVVMRLVNVGQKQAYGPNVTYMPGVWSDPFYGSFGGYYGSAWAGPMVEVATVSTETIVSVETLVYSVDDGKLLWAGMSESFNPSAATDMVQDIAAAAAAELQKAKLIK